MTGYLHSYYAEALAEFGTPRELPQCGGWILARPIPGFPDYDAMGCYPLFACRDWSQLQVDLDNMNDELVSLALVTDPFGEYNLDYLHRCFKDVVIPFKEHYLVDLHRPLNEIGGRRRRKHARQALRKIRVEVSGNPACFVEEWVELYGHLIKKHNIQGIRAFSRTSFAKQLSIPGTTVLYATYEGTIIGAQIYFMQGDVVHCHLGASSEIGYDLGATYALDWYSIEYFSGKARWLDLGGGVGIAGDGTDGLSQYKQGWSTDTRTTYFCGRIFNRERYAEITKVKNTTATNYFPAYRKGEFD